MLSWLQKLLRGMLQDQQWKTLFQFLDAFRHLLAERISEQSLPHLQIKINEALALMERDFPMDIFKYVKFCNYECNIHAVVFFTVGNNTTNITSYHEEY